MKPDETYMLRCLELAKQGAGKTAPNPMVGSVIVSREKIIGEGFHQKYGEPHAEVNAVRSVVKTELLKKSTLYVNLEPCAHHGLTPPCADLIVEKQIPRVVIGTIDPFVNVAGKGIEKLRKAGVAVKAGILEKDCRELNKRFFTFHEKKRPYVILKWAQTLDGFIDIDRTRENFGEPTWITGDLALRLVHKIRSEEGAILVGTNTAEKDNPSLTLRHWTGKNPLRAVIDKKLRLPESLKLFDGSTKTLVFNAKKNMEKGLTFYVKINFEEKVIEQILNELYRRKILSLIVEGGRYLLESFHDSGLWDEEHVFKGDKYFKYGIRAPKIRGTLTAEKILCNDRLDIYRNPG